MYLPVEVEARDVLDQRDLGGKPGGERLRGVFLSVEPRKVLTEDAWETTGDTRRQEETRGEEEQSSPKKKNEEPAGGGGYSLGLYPLKLTTSTKAVGSQGRF